MANNYTQFSVELENLNKTEITWLTEILGTNFATKNPEQIAKILGPAAAKHPDADFSFWPDFDTKITLPRKNRDGMLWLYSEAFGSPVNAALLIHAFMRRFKKKGVVTLTSAYTCSQLRVNEFSGDAWYITASALCQISTIESAVYTALNRSIDQQVTLHGLHISVEVGKEIK